MNIHYEYLFSKLSQFSIFTSVEHTPFNRIVLFCFLVIHLAEMKKAINKLSYKLKIDITNNKTGHLGIFDIL